MTEHYKLVGKKHTLKVDERDFVHALHRTFIPRKVVIDLDINILIILSLS
jgi:hypothetical protein